MKKKLLILLLAVNIIAGSFVLYSFTPKSKNVNDAGGSCIIMRVYEGGGGGGAELSVTDGNTILSQVDLQPVTIAVTKYAEVYRKNNQIITKKINEIRSQGYELISSNNGGGSVLTNYVFLKK